MESLVFEIKDWLFHLHQPQSWLQLAVIGAAAGIAYVINGRFDGHAPGTRTDGLRELAHNTAKRILFPISTLLGVLLGRAVLHSAGMPVQMLNIAVPMMLSLAGIRVVVFMLRTSFAPSAGLKAWENIIATTAWTVVALHLIGWLPDLLEFMDSIAFQLGTAHVSLLSASKMLLMVGTLLTLALWISGMIEKRVRDAEEMSAGVKVGLVKFLRFFLITLSVVIGLTSVGIDLSALAVFGGALGVGLGFGLQRIASNFISGFILIFDRSIRPGDVIRVNDKLGLVKALHARYVVMRNRDGVETLIPNESLITSEVVNLSYSDRNIRLRIPVQIGYDDDPKQAMALMVKLAKEHERVLKDPEPACSFMAFGDNGLALELRVWIDDPEEGVGNVRSDLNLAIWHAFKAAGITFPYAQRDLRIKELPALFSRSAEPEKGAQGLAARS